LNYTEEQLDYLRCASLHTALGQVIVLPMSKR